MIAIINYIGNIGSVKNALDYLEIPNFIADKPEDLKKATHIIIPGVGNWTEGVKRLKPFYKYLKSTKKPMLGICLGYQLLFENSEEGNGKGLCLISGNVGKLPKQHVGWEIVVGEYFYFTHGYVPEIRCGGCKNRIGNPWLLQHKNILGCQFHPEKSQQSGLNFLKDWWEVTK